MSLIGSVAAQAEVTFHLRPGIIIGAAPRSRLNRTGQRTKRDVFIDIRIHKPELDAQLVPNRSRCSSKARVPEAMRKAVSQRCGSTARDQGAGLGPPERRGAARSEWYLQGSFAPHSARRHRYGIAEARTTYGVIGIRPGLSRRDSGAETRRGAFNAEPETRDASRAPGDATGPERSRPPVSSVRRADASGDLPQPARPGRSRQPGAAHPSWKQEKPESEAGAGGSGGSGADSLCCAKEVSTGSSGAGVCVGKPGADRYLFRRMASKP